MFMKLTSIRHTLSNPSIYLRLNGLPNKQILTATAAVPSFPTQTHKWQRYYSGRAQDNEAPTPSPSTKKLPTLMDFPEIIWPSLLNTIKNWVYIHFIIMPYFDRDFNIKEFIKGTKQALQIVSTSLADGDFKVLNNLVTSDAQGTLKNSVSTLSVAQRHELAVNVEDIYFSFPYQIGIMFDETNENIQQRWVEITMVFHILKDLKELQERGEYVNIGTDPHYKHKIIICNYRFIKEFTQGKETDWIVNVVNHFKPAADD